MRGDAAFQAAYWKTFEAFFGTENARVVKASLLARYRDGDTGSGEIDRVCYGLRHTMGWVAEAIERQAISSARGG